jgi:voltage-gated potassium channel
MAGVFSFKDVAQRVSATRRFQRRLFTAQAIGTGTRLLHRAGWALGVFVVVLTILWLDRGGLKDNYDDEISFGDVVYFTFVTITTVGYGDIVPVSDRARLIDGILVTPARLIFIMIFVGTAYDLLVQRWVEGIRMERLQAHLRDHVIICGFGAAGQMAAREMLARGATPAQIVVIDPAEGPLEDAADLGLTGLRGDAARSDVLDDAAVERARGVIVCAGSDAMNALISLAVRRLSRARLVVAAEGLDAKPVMQQSGADAVVSASTLGGYVLADALESPPIADLLVDILSAGGDVEWREIEVPAALVGKPLSTVPGCVVLAVRRNTALLWPWQPAAQSLRPDDRLVVIRECGEQPYNPVRA